MKNQKKITLENQDKHQEQVQAGIEEAKRMLKEPPTEAQVVEWFKSDLHAAVYSLTALISMPSVVEDIAKRFYQESTKPRVMETITAENKLANGK